MATKILTMSKQMTAQAVTEQLTHKLVNLGERLQSQFTAKATPLISDAITSLKEMNLSHDVIAKAIKGVIPTLEKGGYMRPDWLINHLLREAGIRQRAERKTKGKKSTKGGKVSGKSTNEGSPKGEKLEDLAKVTIPPPAGSSVSPLQAALQLLSKLSTNELDILHAQLEKLRAKDAARIDQRTKGATLRL